MKNMRAGSGAVLLVGFALVVMLLSIVGTINQPSIVMKQDPSQDFADIAGSVNEIVKSCENLPSNQINAIKEYIDNTLNTINESLKIKGLALNPLPTQQDNNKIIVFYSLSNYDKSSFFDLRADCPINSINPINPTNPINNPTNNPLPVIVCDKASGRKATCFIRNPCSDVMTIRLEAPAGIHVIFPGQGKGAINSKSGVAEFSLDPMGTDVCPGVSLGRRILAIATVYTDSGYLTLTVKSGCCINQCSFKVPLSCDSVECSLNYGQFLQLLKGISECKGSG